MVLVDTVELVVCSKNLSWYYYIGNNLVVSDGYGSSGRYSRYSRDGSSSSNLVTLVDLIVIMMVDMVALVVVVDVEFHNRKH